MRYGEAKQLIDENTATVELFDGAQARVLVCPEWQGRVMTSTCGCEEGLSFGFVNRRFIESGLIDLRFNNYGGEDRLWLAPEGGPFSLWFAPGAEQTLSNWYTPPDLNRGVFELEGEPQQTCCRMHMSMALENASGSRFRLEVTRHVELLTADRVAGHLGPEVGRVLAAGDAQLVAYETINRITNRGEPMTTEGGMVSIWILGMFQAGSRTVIVVPYKPGDAESLGPPVWSEYFGNIPAERLKVFSQAVLLRADGRHRGKIGVPQPRARNVLGAVDLENQVLTVVQFSMPDDPTKCTYLNNVWGQTRENAYRGEVAAAYNDGPPQPGIEGLGPFYELESLSPCRPLAPGESLEHRHRTFHIQAADHVLDGLATKLLGMGLETIGREMLSL